MKKLLISTALIASMGFAGVSFAQTATPIVDANGDPLYTWVGTNGVVQQGTYTQYTTAVPAITGEGLIYDGVTYDTTEEATAARDADIAAQNESLVALVEGGPENSLAGNQESLLADLLSKAAEIQSTLANTSENLGNIDGSINLDMTRFDDMLPDVSAGGESGANISEAITAKIGNLTTTVIGSLGTGEVDSTAVLSSIDTLSQAMTEKSSALNATFVNGADGEAPTGLQQIYNLSSNLGALDASINVNLAGTSLASMENISGQIASAAGIDNLESQMATWATTAIGSLGNGTITSDITNNASALTQRLVGSN